MLALPTFEVLEALEGQPVVECGAGSGLWIRIMREHGLRVCGFDPEPRGPDVTKGSHKDLHTYSNHLLLVVWPPDGTDLNEWVGVWGGRHFAFVGDTERVTMPRNFKEQVRIQLPGGDKDHSTFYRGIIE